MSLAKIDQAIATINYIIKKRQKKIDEFTRRPSLSDTQRIFIGEETELINNIQTLVKHAKNSLAEHLGKMPPQAVDLEKCVLGAAIFENPAFKAVQLFLKPSHFYNESHKEIWDATLQVGKIGLVDLKSVIAELRRKGMLESVGGHLYIVELTSAVSSSANIEYHARIIIEMAIKRELIRMSGSVLHDGYDDTTDCFELLETAEEQIKEIRSWIK